MLLYLSRFSYGLETWARLIGNPDARRVGASHGRDRDDISRRCDLAEPVSLLRALLPIREPRHDSDTIGSDRRCAVPAGWAR